MRSLRRILHVTRFDQIPNTDVLERCKCVSIEGMLLQRQLQWTGHVIRMPDSRIPKQLLYGELAEGRRKAGGQKKRYKDAVQGILKSCGLPQNELEGAARNRTGFRKLCRVSGESFERRRQEELRGKREARHHPTALPPTVFVCDLCGRDCHSRIGLFAHRRSHRPDSSNTTT